MTEPARTVHPPSNDQPVQAAGWAPGEDLSGGDDAALDGARRGRTRPTIRWAVAGLAVVAAVAVWIFLSRTEGALFVPSPNDVLRGARDISKDGQLQADILASYYRVIIGWALGGLVGIPLGLMAGRIRILNTALAPFVNFFRFVPPIALVSLAIIWLGIGNSSKIALIFYASTFLVFLNVAAGAAGVDPNKIRAAQSLGSSRLHTFMFVIVPDTVPAFVTGLRVAMSNSFSAVVAAELVAAQSGIGYLIFQSRLVGRTDLVFVGILTLGLMGMLADLIFRLLVRRISYRYDIHA